MIERITIYKTPGGGQVTNFVARAQNNGWVIRLIDATQVVNNLQLITRPKTNCKVVFVVENIEFLSSEETMNIFKAIDYHSWFNDETVVFRIQNQDNCPEPEGTTDDV